MQGAFATDVPYFSAVSCGLAVSFYRLQSLSNEGALSAEGQSFLGVALGDVHKYITK